MIKKEPVRGPISWLTVALATKDHASFLTSCLEGILSQSWKEFEFLILDDASTDATWSILQKYANRDPRIRLFRHSQNKGVIDSYNFLFRQAKGQFIWSVATDDTCINPFFLGEGFAQMERFPKAAGFYGAMKLVSMPEENFLRNWSAGKRSKYLKPRNVLKLFWKDLGYPCGPSLVLKRSWYEKAGFFQKDLGPQCDSFLGVCAAGTCGIVYLHHEAVIHRIWPSHESFLSSQTKEDLLKNLGRMERLLRANLPGLVDRPKQWNLWRMGAILRATNFEHQLKIYFRKKRPRSPWTFFPLLRNLFRAAKIFASGLRVGDLPRLAGTEANPKFFVTHLTKNILIFSLHTFTWRFFYRLRKSLEARFYWL